jgi:hypothetical protein
MVAEDRSGQFGIGRTSPAEGVFLITPSNSEELAIVTRGISFAAAGALKIITPNDETVVIPADALAAGIIHPIRAKKVFATGTTATGIVGYY